MAGRSKITASSATPRWHRGVSIATITLLLFLSLLHYSLGQDTTTIADEAAAATATTDVDAPDNFMGDVTDLGDVVGDAMADLTELLDNLDSEEVFDDTGIATAAGAEDKTTEALAAAAAASVGDNAAEINAESAETATNAESSTNAETMTQEGSEVIGASPESETSQEGATLKEEPAPVVQSGPFIDLLGDVLLSLEMVDETHAQVHQHYTNEALSGKKVVGLYFSADWCGPCRQFTPDLVNFYDKMNARRGKRDEFEIVWISRCRTVDDFGQYFTHMKWLALPPNEAMGQRGQYLGDKYKVKSIPTLVLLDEIGNVITTDARNKIPMDKAGIGFPWRSPLSVIVSTLVPKSFRLLVKSQIAGVLALVKGVLLGKGSKLKKALANGRGQS